MTIPKLYLIKSQEREELVKIGVTGTGDQNDESDIVKKRIQDYQAGISDPSDVYETPGSYIFEKYLHKFLRDYRKNIPITFKASNETIGGPREWFELQPNVVEAMRDAFSQEHPTTIDQVNAEDLPVFLSGLFSAIQWQAEYNSVEKIAELLRGDGLLSMPNEYRQGKPGIGTPMPSLDTTLLSDKTNQNVGRESETITDLPQSSANLVTLARLYAEVERFREEMSEMRYMETSRTFIAFIGIACALYLAIAGASLTFFVIFTFGLLALWPYAYPHIAINTIGLWQWLETMANRSRQAGRRYE